MQTILKQIEWEIFLKKMNSRVHNMNKLLIVF